MDGQGQLFEISVSFRYAQEHDWVMQAITGFLSAYFMEDARFRLKRHRHELETGMYVWICEAPGEKFMRRLLKRLQVDIPPFELYQRDSDSDRPTRHVIDLPALQSGPEESAAP